MQLTTTGVETVSGSWPNGSPAVKANKAGVDSQTSQFLSERLPLKQFSKLVTLSQAESCACCSLVGQLVCSVRF